MNRTRYAISGGLLFVVLLALTPLGPWALTRLLSVAAAFSSWQVSVDGHAGSLAGRFVLEGVKVGDGAGLAVEVERLEIALWDYQVDVLRPEISWVQAADGVEEEEAAAEQGIHLPVSSLPNFTLRHGTVELGLPSSAMKIRLDGLDASYRATADTTGELQLSFASGDLSSPSFSLAQVPGTLQVELTPRAVHLDSLHLAAVVDTLPVELAAWGTLSLLSLKLRTAIRLSADSPTAGGAAVLGVGGRLDSLDLQIRVDATGHHERVGDVEVRARVQVTPAKAVLNSSAIHLWGGELQVWGVYHLTSDTLEAQAWLEDLDLAHLSSASVGGQVSGTLAATADLGNERFDADLELALRQVDFIEGNPLDIHLEAAYRPDRNAQVEVRSSAFSLTARGPIEPDGTYDLALEGTAEPAVLVDFNVAPVRLEGRARTEKVHLHLESARPPRELGEFGALALDLDLVEQRFLKAVLTLEEDLLQFELGMDLETGRVDSLTGALSPLALARLIPGIEGELSGQVRATGALDGADLQAVSNFAMEAAAYQGWRSGPLALDLEYREKQLSGVLEGSGLEVEVGLDAEQNLQVQALFSGAVLRRAGAADSTDSTDVVELVGALEWKGNLERLGEAQVQLDLEHLLWRQGAFFARADGPLRLRRQGRHTRIESVRLHTTLGPLVVEGDVRGDSLDVAVLLAPLDLEQWAPGVSAEGVLQLALGGTVERPRIEGSAELHRVFLDSLLLGDLQVELQVADSLELEAALSLADSERPEIELALSAPTAALLAGAADTTAAARLELGVHQLDLEALFTYFLEEPTSGLIDIEADLSLPLSLLQTPTQWRDLAGYWRFNALQLKTAYTADTLRLELPQSGEILLRDTHIELRQLTLQVQRYDEEVERYLPAGSLDLSGDVRADSAGRIALVIADLDLLTFGGPEGKMNLQAQLGGAPQKPELAVDLEIETEDLGDVTGRIDGDEKGVGADFVWSTLLADELRVDGHLPWDWQERRVDFGLGWLNLASENIDLFVFLEQLPDLDDIDGRLAIDVRLQGFDENMSLQGSVALLDTLSLALLDTEPAYWFTSGQVEFVGRQALLVDFAGTSEENAGIVELAGRLDLSNFEDLGFELQVLARGLPYRYEQIFSVPGIDIDLALTGAESRSSLSGQIGLRDALTELTVIKLRAPTPPPRPPTLRDEMLENLTLDIFTSIEELELDSESAQGLISGGINVSGTFYKPTFQGDLEIEEGKIIIFNRPFEIQQGRISLNSLVPTQSLVDLAYDPLLLDPEVELAALYSVVDSAPDPDIEYTVTMSVQGPALTAAPEFAADPVLEFDEIVRLLVFGSTSSTGLDYETALSMAAGQLLSKKVEKIGLDEFVVLPSGTVFNTTRRRAIRIGKNLEDLPLSLWVQYEAAIEELSYGELRIEHRLTPYLTIIGISQSEYDRYGLGVGVKKDF